MEEGRFVMLTALLHSLVVLVVVTLYSSVCVSMCMYIVSNSTN